MQHNRRWPTPNCRLRRTPEAPMGEPGGGRPPVAEQRVSVGAAAPLGAQETAGNLWKPRFADAVARIALAEL
eukprot:10355930-Alexandrium_andersonii.AAC.1